MPTQRNWRRVRRIEISSHTADPDWVALQTAPTLGEPISRPRGNSYITYHLIAVDATGASVAHGDLEFAELTVLGAYDVAQGVDNDDLGQPLIRTFWDYPGMELEDVRLNRGIAVNQVEPGVPTYVRLGALSGSSAPATHIEVWATTFGGNE